MISIASQRTESQKGLPLVALNIFFSCELYPSTSLGMTALFYFNKLSAASMAISGVTPFMQPKSMGHSRRKQGLHGT